MTQLRGLYLWRDYWGELLFDEDSQYPSRIFGFENFSVVNRQRREASIQTSGTSFGFVQHGNVQISNGNLSWPLLAQQWFSINGNIKLELSEQSRMVLMQLSHYRGMQCLGGPIEDQGRLRYIDGCSDTLLCAPPVKGDPCLNHLHFPGGIDQTEHNHPSARAGMVASGMGLCQIPGESFDLTPGIIFYIKKSQNHKFSTSMTQKLNIIAYHPDSDWGPTHEEHPMINRTWVEGEKIDNSVQKHLHDNIISGN